MDGRANQEDQIETAPEGSGMTDIDDDTPLRLAEAARRCFPDGSMKAAGLRRLAKKGLLSIERMNGRDYTTLRAIQEMREQCRVKAKVRACGSDQPGAIETAKITVRSGLSSIEAAKSRLGALLKTQQEPNRH
jgi:hypothetical protein